MEPNWLQPPLTGVGNPGPYKVTERNDAIFPPRPIIHPSRRQQGTENKKVTEQIESDFGSDFH